ncbi:MAG: deoxyribodipyrimidine photo-lyase, partial [Gammaproteobacteria bacterium]|nr:deoxyribodipyrimidine photo-lyase [Gammaproteobacteria bacterium]
MQQLIWFRNDLRISDNSALHAALQAGPTVAVFLLSPGQWLAHDDAACKIDFILRNLVELEKSLATLNVPLLIRTADQWQQAPEVLLELCQQLNISAVHVNTEYGIHESQRDMAVGADLVDQGVLFHSHLDRILFKPGTVLTQSGTYFKVFSQFRKICYQYLYDQIPACIETPQAQAALSINSDPIPTQ